MRAKNAGENAGEKIVEDFFAKLAAVLDLTYRQSQCWCIMLMKLGLRKFTIKSRCKVLARRGQKTVRDITSGEREKDPHCTHVRVCSWPCYSTTNHISKSLHTRKFEHLQASSLPHL